MSDIFLKTNREYISSKSAAKLYRLTHDHVARLCREGKIKGALDGRNWLVDKESLDSFFSHRRQPVRAEDLPQEKIRLYELEVAVPPAIVLKPNSSKTLKALTASSLLGVILVGGVAFANGYLHMLDGQQLASALFGTTPIQNSQTLSQTTAPEPTVAIVDSSKISTSTTIQSTPPTYIIKEIISRPDTLSNVASGALTQEQLLAQLNDVKNDLQSQISFLQNPGRESPLQNFYVPGVINNLSNLTTHGDTKSDNILATYVNAGRLDVSGGVSVGGVFSAATTSLGSISISGGTTLSNATTTGNAYFAGNVGIGTTSPVAALALQGNGYYSGTSFFGGAITATSTLTLTGLATLNGGLTSFASSTIGSGLQAEGLTIFGGATTTGNMSLGGVLTIGGAQVPYSINIPNTNGSAQWVKLGTLTLGQQGQSALVKIVSNNGYNALISQNFEAYIRFKTSNGSDVNGSGFAGDSSFYTTGEGSLSDSTSVKWVANTGGSAATTYDLYVKFTTFSGDGNFYTVEVPSGAKWVSNVTAGQSDPGSASATVLVATKEFSAMGGGFVINSTGNVGVGTTNPSDGRLQVQTGTADGDAVALSLKNRTNQSANTKVSQTFFADDNEMARITVGRDGASTAGTFNLLTAKGSAPTSSFYIDTAGKIGISTTTPWRTLSVNGNSDLGTSALAGFFTATSTTATSTFAGSVGIGTTTPNAGLGVASDAPTRFWIESSTGAGNMRDIEVDSSGLVTLGYYYKLGDGYILRTDSVTKTLIVGGEATMKFYKASAGSYIVDSANYPLISGAYDGFHNYKNFGYGSNTITFNNVGVGDSVGVGSTTPWAKFSVSATGGGSAPLFTVASSTSGLATSTALLVTSTGLVGIGTTTPGAALDVYNGALCVDDSSPTCQNAARTAGTIYAVATAITGIDLAERYPTKDATLHAGEIVSFDPANPVFVSRATSTAPFLGVVSTKPGVELGGYNESLYKDEKKVPIALAGRVPVTVNLEGGPISVGDRITMSSVAGVGAKATTTERTIGVALEPYSGGTATSSIQVFIDPEMTFDGPSLASLVDLQAFASSTESAVATLHTPFLDGFIANLLSRISGWLADATNGIARIFAKEINTETLCIKKSDETRVCITGDQLSALLSAQGTGPQPSTPDTPTPPGDAPTE